MEEFLSQKTAPFEFRDLMAEPLTPDELWRLMHDQEGRQLGPQTRVGKGVVMGFDPVRLGEYLEQYPDVATNGVTVYGRPDDVSTRRMLDHLAERSVPATFVDLTLEPLSREDLWKLMEIPGSNIRTPLTDVNGTLVLGYDTRRLEELLASRAN